ncbi:MAG: c-type cytochrome, partial [Limisphaerales bacterium]
MKTTTKTLVIGALFSASVILPAGAEQLSPPELWSKNCLTCHGKEGRGDTKAGQRAKVKDMTDKEYQSSFNDEKAFTSIKQGLKEGGRELMKSFHDKLSDEEIKSLVA